MLESFCNIHDLEPAAVFTMVQRACSSGLLDDEFLPSILQVADRGAGAGRPQRPSTPPVLIQAIQ